MLQSSLRAIFHAESLESSPSSPLPKVQDVLPCRRGGQGQTDVTHTVRPCASGRRSVAVKWRRKQKKAEVVVLFCCDCTMKVKRVNEAICILKI